MEDRICNPGACQGLARWRDGSFTFVSGKVLGVWAFWASVCDLDLSRCLWPHYQAGSLEVVCSREW